MFDLVMQSEGAVLSKSVRQRPSQKQSENGAVSASVVGDMGQTSLESGKASKNSLSGIVSDCAGFGWY